MPEAAAPALPVNRAVVCNAVGRSCDHLFDPAVSVAFERLYHPAGNNVPDSGQRNEHSHSAAVGVIFFIVTHAAALVRERSDLQRDDIVLCQRHQISPRLLALRYAYMKPSMSPSITAWILPLS